MKMVQTECSETSAYKIQTSGNFPEESIKHSQNILEEPSNVEFHESQSSGSRASKTKLIVTEFHTPTKALLCMIKYTY